MFVVGQKHLARRCLRSIVLFFRPFFLFWNLQEDVVNLKSFHLDQQKASILSFRGQPSLEPFVPNLLDGITDRDLISQILPTYTVVWVRTRRLYMINSHSSRVESYLSHPFKKPRKTHEQSSSFVTNRIQNGGFSMDRYDRSVCWRATTIFLGNTRNFR